MVITIRRLFSTSDVLDMDETLVMMDREVDFFEVDGGEKEGEGWASMLGFFIEESMGLFIFGIIRHWWSYWCYASSPLGC